jgi:ribosomal protein L1
MKNTKRKIDPNKPKIKIPIGKKYIAVKEIVNNNKLLYNKFYFYKDRSKI